MMSWLILTLAGFAICAWAFFSLVESPARGEWRVKLTILAIFGSCLWWTLDRLIGDHFRWDGTLFLVSLAAYLWVASPPCALFRRLRYARPPAPPQPKERP